MAVRSTIGRPAAYTGGRDLVITRFFDAPRELVWRAWTEPGLLRRWWGPSLFTAPVSMIDLRVGGSYLHCMRSPEGKDYWRTGVYREIVPLKRIAATDSFADEKGNVVPAKHYGIPGRWPAELLVAVSISDRGKGTIMTMRHAGFPTMKTRMLASTGWGESFDKLAEVLKTATTVTAVDIRPGRPEIVLRRTYDAPRDLVFRAYTDSALIPQWWGPRMYATIVDRLEAKPGGLWRFLNRDAAGQEYAFHGVYHEVRSPERLVATFEFEGAPGKVSLETLTLDESGGRTVLANRSVFQSVDDRDEMVRHGMMEGASETMDRLGELLEKLQAERRAA